MMARPEARARANCTVRADLAAWLDDEGDRRVVARRILLDVAVELLRSAIAGGHEDLLAELGLPPAPRERAAS